MRGEDTKPGRPRLSKLGSPPHARGRRLEFLQDERRSRITPACAGKTFCIEPKSDNLVDHPRMRGEDLSYRYASNPRNGSPPHARGRHRCEDTHGDPIRITPACAGKTIGSGTMYMRARDHPRMRGEDFRVLAPGGVLIGSPPHARGRPFFGGILRFCTGITPACAGKTGIFRPSAARREDHPRMRGEDKLQFFGGEENGGSPPHARGRLNLKGQAIDALRITPACAGKT